MAVTDYTILQFPDAIPKTGTQPGRLRYEPGLETAFSSQCQFTMEFPAAGVPASSDEGKGRTFLMLGSD
jgi:hypothetical protein